MSWIILFFAGLFEVGWAVGLKYTDGFSRPLPTALTVAAMAVSLETRVPFLHLPLVEWCQSTPMEARIGADGQFRTKAVLRDFVAQRLPDGAVFVPKPSQRILGLANHKAVRDAHPQQDRRGQNARLDVGADRHHHPVEGVDGELPQRDHLH